MKSELPSPEEILEELADKVAAQIERLAPVAFDRAVREMTRYHRFLLAVGASRDPNGSAFNFAEIAGNAWHAPHKEWIKQYRRLFERAADKLVDDDHFVRSLAYVPGRLMPKAGDPELSPNVVRAILDLGPLLVGRLEAWVTKRTTVEIRRGQAAEPRLALAGSDAKAYESVVPDIVGAWESLLHYPPSMYGWSERGEQTDIVRWAAFKASWPFLWQHLTNTAYCLASAVWNEDEIGAALFREALVRWAHALDHRLDDRAELRHRRLLFPSILDLNWPEASLKGAALGYDYMPSPTPDQLFASVIRGAHDDIVLLTASLLLSWTINEKQASDIGARTARALLSREASEINHAHVSHQPTSFRSLFLDLLRLEMTGERYRDGSYGADLDHSVAVLDNMTERRVVPGRVFTPSTLHGRDGLLLSSLVILLAHVPDEGDDGLKERINALTHEEEVLPAGDGSLRDIMHQLGQFKSMLEQPYPALARGLQLLSPDQDAELAKARLREIISRAWNEIEEKRRRRLEARPVDPAKLERLRSAIEEALLTSEVEAPFFRDVEVGRAAEDDSAEWHDMTFSGIGKAQLTEPPMEAASSSFIEMLISGYRDMAGRHAWNTFCQRPRIEVTVAGGAEEEAFWRDIRPLVQQVGPQPVLVVSRNAEGRALRRFLYAPAADRPGLEIEQRPLSGRGASYIATVEGVDVFGADFRPGEAWLFSANSLREVRYAKTATPDRHAELSFELGDEMKGTLRVRVRQVLKWANLPTFELKSSDPTADEEPVD
ncbi:hypothetical protein H7F51_01720 [Novosphingobium flavum]|uniref:Uncharacterized protein n=1 Tax=Novosphingobium flavum TaxID=1778672 RepID=A0A7X1KKI6_9SPHN|nr:hypothetical protein [Novosphingobium flavum]MBC2664230.1 hypothetical protein [Novosphingobium flavum]